MIKSCTAWYRDERQGNGEYDFSTLSKHACIRNKNFYKKIVIFLNKVSISHNLYCYNRSKTHFKLLSFQNSKDGNVVLAEMRLNGKYTLIMYKCIDITMKNSELSY